MKHTTHKLIGILLAVVMLVCIIPTIATPVAAAPITGTCGNSISWMLDGGTLTLTGSGAMYDYDFDYGKTYDYTKAKTPWAKYTTQITAVKADAAITHIGEMAFFHCTRLQSVELPGVLTVAKDAFAGCSALKSLSLPAAVTIDDGAFAGCGAMTALEAPAAVYIGDNAFEKTAISAVSMPAAKSIGSSAFAGCYNLASASLPNVQSIGGSAFANCRVLLAADFPKAANIGAAAFSECHKLQSINLPALTNLKADTFRACIALTEVSLPAAVSMESHAFSGCTALKSVDLPALLAVPDHGFELLKALESANVPKAMVLGKYAFNACQSLTAVTIPSVTDVQPHAFRYCTALTDVDLSKIASIPDSCFYGCESLESITAPLTTRVGDFAFQECKALKVVDFPAALHIGNCAFYKCSALTEAYIPAVKTIDQNAFNRCTALKQMSISTDLEVVNARAFEGCSALKTLYVKSTKAKWEPLTVATLNNDYFNKAEKIIGDAPFTLSPLPKQISAVKGSNAQLTITAHGSMLSYQWQRYDRLNETWVNIQGATSAKLVFGPVTMDHNSTLLRCAVTDRSGTTLNSDPVELKVSPFADTDGGAYYAQPLLWALEQGITTGTSETTFSPDAACTRAQVVTFLWRANGKPAPASSETKFTDIPADAYYRDAVLWAVEQGITTGTSETTFSPDAACTRGQIVTLLWRAGGKPAAESTASFKDVPADAYYADAVRWASDTGITTGTSATTFSPDDPCTRAQIVTFLYRS